MSAAKPACPICLQPATGATAPCRTCHAVYHASCWPPGGCVVPGCTMPKPVKKAAPVDLDRSAAWQSAKNCLGVVLIGFVVMIVLSPLGALAAIGGMMIAAGTPCAYLAVTWACAEDLVTGKAAGRQWGNGAFVVVTWLFPAALFLGGAIRSPAMSQFDMMRNVLGLAIGCAVAGVVFDRRKHRALVAVAVAGITYAAMPDFRGAASKANIRACYANQKTIVGAVEMYNLDKNTKRMQLDGAFFEALKSGGYLQTVPQDPGANDPSSSSHYSVTMTGNGVRCSDHGSIQ